MGLFTPKGLGRTIKCSRCGKKFYEIEDIRAAGDLRVKGYYPTLVFECENCGSCTCEMCRSLMMRGCTCGKSSFRTVSVMKKMG